MNIKAAKQQITYAMRAYFSKDQYGQYVVPIERQRPVFLLGSPGIGKTAIMEQVAQELGVPLLAYSMTHHTRQSALGLPYITTKTYAGEEIKVSEYTMSEIIMSVYDVIEQTGQQEGILFLDEINCVSETLAPTMLQFLQYKVFGRHQVPAGWIVVTAGNPPEYNKSVREFDIVTWDRLKKIEVEPDFATWKEYAYKKNVHPAILTYLEIKKQDFYCVETTVEGKKFVTARSWMDLSEMMHLYEKNAMPVNEDLIGQYLQHQKISRDFTIYYDLFNKYRSDYEVENILEGQASSEVKQRAQDASFDERLTFIGLLLNVMVSRLREVMDNEEVILKIKTHIQAMKIKLNRAKAVPADVINKVIVDEQSKLEDELKLKKISQEKQLIARQVIDRLHGLQQIIITKEIVDGKEAYEALKAAYTTSLTQLKQQTAQASKQLAHMFKFCEEVFQGSQLILILVTELTVNSYASQFITRHGSPDYFRHNKELLFFERQQQLLHKINQLE